MSCLPEPAITSCDTGHWIPLWQLSIGHFRVPPGLCIKTRLGAQLFLWKWVLFAWEWKIISISKIEHLTSFWCRGPEELGNGLLNITWMSNRSFPHYAPVSKHNKKWGRGWGDSCIQISVFCPPKPRVGAFVYGNAGKVYTKLNTDSICLGLLASIKVCHFTYANMKGWTILSCMDDLIFLSMVFCAKDWAPLLCYPRKKISISSISLPSNLFCTKPGKLAHILSRITNIRCCIYDDVFVNWATLHADSEIKVAALNSKWWICYIMWSHNTYIDYPLN